MAWLLLASAAMAAGSPPLEAPAPRGGPIIITMPVGHELLAPSTEQGEILTLQAERYDRFTLEVMIGDHGPYDFMIDTGSQATVLAVELADRLGLHERQPAMLIGMASTLPVEVARIPISRSAAWWSISISRPCSNGGISAVWTAYWGSTASRANVC